MTDYFFRRFYCNPWIRKGITHAITVVILPVTTISCGQSQANNHQTISLLNVSYDISRDFYKEYNPHFIKHYQTHNPHLTIDIKQSHGGSSKQALSIVNGLKADVATMNQGSDIEILQHKGMVADNWEGQFPNNAVPFTSTIVFLVRKGNPKGINDWQDLAQQDIQIVMANPKVTGSGRYAFLGAYGYGLHTFNNDKHKTNTLLKGILSNVTVYDNGGRSATTTFAQRQIGDVLITFENEANLAKHTFVKGEVDIVYPRYSIKSESPVAIVNTVADKKGTANTAKAYLDYLWSEPAQQLAADLYLRPSVPAILAKNSDRLPPINTFRPVDVFGTWDEIMPQYFAEGALFDTLSRKQ